MSGGGRTCHDHLFRWTNVGQPWRAPEMDVLLSASSISNENVLSQPLRHIQAWGSLSPSGTAGAKLDTSPGCCLTQRGTQGPLFSLSYLRLTLCTQLQMTPQALRPAVSRLPSATLPDSHGHCTKDPRPAPSPPPPPSLPASQLS